MRSIPITSLALTVTLNETNYTGMMNSDGQWSVEVPLSPNQQYDLLVQWYSSEILLLEEFGQFTTPATGSIINPVLDYRSAGTAEFDVDCDGYSNLEEVNNGTSLTIAEGLTTSACSEETTPIELKETERAWMGRVHDPVGADENTERMTNFSQTFQINTSTDSGNIAFIVNLRANPVDATTNETLTHAGWISFRQQPNVPTFMEFAIYPSTGVLEADVEGQFCKDLGSSPAGMMCTVPYNWQLDRWYTLSLEETTPTTWRAQVLDQQSQITQPIATFTTPENLIWEELSTGMIDYIEYPSADCIAGLPPSRMTYKPAIVNNVPVGTRRLRISDCVRGGAGWSEGLRTVQDALEHKMTMGRDP